MSDVVIRAEGLGKRYLIGHESGRERYTALRDVMTRTATGLARSAVDMLRGRQLVTGDEVEEFWALKDVSFEIKRGEAVGIVGRNGAGKSTLLKILSRITEPSAGRVTIKGRVASLLEVGTGFHPELSGRENIYLNGAILGMTRAEIRRKFDEIVAFAEVKRFLDTPVKRYSSGMYVRLAFAVAAHLEPEILIVDEVLAVGDAEFQKKCLGKMGELAGAGRTVLFVSHNIGALISLCAAGILLKNGVIAQTGCTDGVVQAYLANHRGESSEVEFETSDSVAKSDVVTILSARVCNAGGKTQNMFLINEDIFVEVAFEILKEEPNIKINLHIIRVDGIYVCASIDSSVNKYLFGRSIVIMRIPRNFLSAGKHYITIYASSFAPDIPHVKIDEVLSFEVLDIPNSVTRQGFKGPFPGAVRPQFDWNYASSSK